MADWETANVFIDPTGEDDGQKVAMQMSPWSVALLLSSIPD